VIPRPPSARCSRWTARDGAHLVERVGGYMIPVA
jgi:hypothetical protein